MTCCHSGCRSPAPRPRRRAAATASRPIAAPAPRCARARRCVAAARAAAAGIEHAFEERQRRRESQGRIGRRAASSQSAAATQGDAPAKGERRAAACRSARNRPPGLAFRPSWRCHDEVLAVEGLLHQSDEPLRQVGGADRRRLVGDRNVGDTRRAPAGRARAARCRRRSATDARRLSKPGAPVGSRATAPRRRRQRGSADGEGTGRGLGDRLAEGREGDETLARQGKVHLHPRGDFEHENRHRRRPIQRADVPHRNREDEAALAGSGPDAPREQCARRRARPSCGTSPSAPSLDARRPEDRRR